MLIANTSAIAGHGAGDAAVRGRDDGRRETFALAADSRVNVAVARRVPGGRRASASAPSSRAIGRRAGADRRRARDVLERVGGRLGRGHRRPRLAAARHRGRDRGRLGVGITRIGARDGLHAIVDGPHRRREGAGDVPVAHGTARRDPVPDRCSTVSASRRPRGPRRRRDRTARDRAGAASAVAGCPRRVCGPS